MKVSEDNLITFLNVHFCSKELARKITDSQQHAFLHFVYNPRVIGVLINYSYRDGLFAMHFPMTSSEVELMKAARSQEEVISNKIREMFSFQFNYEIQSHSFWKMKKMLAQEWFKERIVLCGDSAHCFPPAGGFGMNSGIEDAYELSSKFLLMNKFREV